MEPSSLESSFTKLVKWLFPGCSSLSSTFTKIGIKPTLFSQHSQSKSFHSFQVELVHAQFKRAKERVEAPDSELYSDLSSAYNVADADAVDPAILTRLAQKLQLTTITDLKKESLALHELIVSNGGEDPGEKIERMSMLLKKIKDHVQTQSFEMGTPVNPNVVLSDEKPKVPVVPDDFRCPISLELMKDPVIVATGQVLVQSQIPLLC